jgi:drug/metabolite transporter (DMT)-like permease
LISDEPITLSLIIGAALVISGVVFGALIKPKRLLP